MTIFSFPQYEGEQFHTYFPRFQDYVEYLASCGYTFYYEGLGRVILEELNLESWNLANYMGNGQVLSIDDSYRWDFFFNMSTQCLQVEVEQRQESHARLESTMIEL